MHIALRAKRAAIALALLLSVVSQPAASTEIDTDAVRFREAFGLAADPVTIALAEAASDTASEFGVVLLDAEMAEMARRDEIGSQLPPLGRSLAQAFPSFAGIFLDQKAGGVVGVAFTEVTDNARQEVLTQLPATADVRFSTVENSLSALQRIQTAIDNSRSALAARGIEVWETSVQVRTNRVEIVASAAPDWLLDEFTDLYGSDTVSVSVAVSPETTGCTNRDNCPGPPLEAGTHLYDAGCSIGFGAIFDSSGTRGFLTAGHCANLVPAGHVYQHPNGTNLGTMLAETYFYDSSADAGFVDVPDAKASNRAYVTAGSYFPIWTQQPKSEEYIGMPVCLSGRQRGEGVDCGELYATGVTIVYGDGTRLLNQRSATYPLSSGDSGGAVLRGNKAIGIQSGVNSAGRGIYSHISYVLSASYGVDATLILTDS
jgi:hypothetical protein